MTTARSLDRLAEQIGELQERRGGSVSWEELRGFRGRFPEFCREILDFDLTPQQAKAWKAIQSSGASQALVMGGNGLGKDRLASAIAIYEAVVNDSLSILTGPTERQVREVLMRREVAGHLRRARGKIAYELFSLAVRFPGLEHGEILAFTAADPDRFTGHHAPRVCVFITEAQGIPLEIFQAAQKCKVGSGLILAVGNPNRAEGAAYVAFRSGAWLTDNWSAFDHPNLLEGREVIPGGPTREWVQEMADEYGEDSAFYVSAVLGQWPAEGSVDALIQRSWIDAAFERFKKGPNYRPREPLVLSLDVARSFDRDESVVAVAQPGTVFAFHSWRSRDLVVTTDRFLALAEQEDAAWRRIGHGGLRLVVDAAGIGSGVVDMARNRGEWVAEYWGWNPSRERRFANRRAEDYWRLRSGLELDKTTLPPDETLAEDLLAMEWTMDSKGQILMLAKDDIRRKLGRSPDRADAVVMALSEAEPSRRATTFRHRV